MFHRLGPSLIQNTDAQVLHHVDPLHVHARSCKAAHGLHCRDQHLDEARSQSHLCSGNLRFSLNNLPSLTEH